MEIARGAEAVILKEGNHIIKKRVSKGYRYPSLDFEIRKLSTRREVKLLTKASKFVNVPSVIKSSDTEMKIVLDFIDGIKVRDLIDSLSDAKRRRICFDIGKSVGLLHSNGIIHGDLTTSNFIFSEGKIYFIDFGLGFFDNHVEHMAVDIHLLKQAFESKHYAHFEDSFEWFLKGYAKYCNKFSEVMKRFSAVEKRGRYKRKKN